MIAFVSGKGGVGKTSLAVNVAIELARTGRRPVILDADHGLANVDVLLDLQPRADLHDLLADARPAGECLTPAAAGVRVVCGVSGARGPLPARWTPRLAARVLARVTPFSDATIVDCGAGIGSDVLAFAHAADTVVVVTTPEPTALVDAYATIKTLLADGFGGRIGVFVNLAGGVREAERTATRLLDTSNRFLGRAVECFGWAPRDPCLPKAIAQRRPLLLRYPRSRAAGNIADLAERLRPKTVVPPRAVLLTLLADLFA